MPKTPRLKEFRDRASLAQQELAEISGVSRATIADAEAGNRTLQPKTLRKLAGALGARPEELVATPKAPAPRPEDELPRRVRWALSTTADELESFVGAAPTTELEEIKHELDERRAEFSAALALTRRERAFEPRYEIPAEDRKRLRAEADRVGELQGVVREELRSREQESVATVSMRRDGSVLVRWHIASDAAREEWREDLQSRFPGGFEEKDETPANAGREHV